MFRLEGLLQARGVGYHDFERLHYVLGHLDMLRPLSRPTLGRKHTVDLVLSRQDVTALTNQAAAFSRMSFIRDEDKTWREAEIGGDGGPQRIKFKLHGTSTTPYRYGGFSIKIKHPEVGSTYLHGMRRYTLVTLLDEVCTPVIAVNRLAANMGLLAPWGDLVLLRINGVEAGLFYLVEDHKKEWLEREHGITNYTVIRPNDDWDHKSGGHVSDLDLAFVNQETEGTSGRPDLALGVFVELVEALEADDVETLKRLVDIDYSGRFLAAATLFNNIHSVTGDNLRLIYDFSRGRFYPLFRQEGQITDSASWRVSEFNRNWFATLAPSDTHTIFRALVRDPEVRARRDAELFRIVSDREGFLALARTVFDDNEPTMRASNYPRRLFSYYRFKFFRSLGITLDLAETYLNYAKLHVTVENTAAGELLHLLPDSYQPLRVEALLVQPDRPGSLGEGAGEPVVVPFEAELSAPVLDEELRMVHVPRVLKLPADLPGRPVGVRARNATTGRPLNDSDVYINGLTRLSPQSPNQATELVARIRAAGAAATLVDGAVTLGPGAVLLQGEIVLRGCESLTLAPGTQVRMGAGSSLVARCDITAVGTAEAPIVVERADPEQAFGTLALLGDGTDHAVFSHFHIRGGGEAFVDGAHFTGQLAVHAADLRMTSSVVSGSASDDGLNVKMGVVHIEDSAFVDNLADQIDFDFCRGSVSNSSFRGGGADDNGDGLDISASRIEAVGNTFVGLSDKALSIGESSIVLARDNRLVGNRTGFAVKDGSVALVHGNELIDNAIDFTLFIKKPFYSSPRLFTPRRPTADRITLTEGEVQVATVAELNKLFAE